MLCKFITLNLQLKTESFPAGGISHIQLNDSYISVWLGYAGVGRANREPSLIQRKHPQAEKAPLSYSSHTAVGENSISNICSLHHHAMSITELMQKFNALSWWKRHEFWGSKRPSHVFFLQTMDIRGCPVSTYYVSQFGSFQHFLPFLLCIQNKSSYLFGSRGVSMGQFWLFLYFFLFSPYLAFLSFLGFQ